VQIAQTFWAKGHSVLFLVHLIIEDKFLYDQVSKTENKIYLTSLFVGYGLILLPSELFHVVTSCKIVTSSMKFKFFHKIAIIQDKFFVLFNLLQGPDITHSAGYAALNQIMHRQ